MAWQSGAALRKAGLGEPKSISFPRPLGGQIGVFMPDLSARLVLSDGSKFRAVFVSDGEKWSLARFWPI